MRTPHRLLLGCATLTLTLVAIAFVPAANAAQEPCANAGASPAEVSNHALRRALRCIVDEERAAAGLVPLRGQSELHVAARDHARDMVKRGYFAHEREGSTTRSRLRDAGWDGHSAGETLAWGCGSLGVPRAIVDGWLGSPAHRDILLGRSYRRAGIGLAVGAPEPTDCPGAGTWVMVVGN